MCSQNLAYSLIYQLAYNMIGMLYINSVGRVLKLCAVYLKHIYLAIIACDCMS